jgi:hypothetical protein
MATLKWSPVLVRSPPVDESTPRSGLRETRFADLQRKYSRVLGAKTHGEYEANLGDKGVVSRFRRIAWLARGGKRSMHTTEDGMASHLLRSGHFHGV